MYSPPEHQIFRSSGQESQKGVDGSQKRQSLSSGGRHVFGEPLGPGFHVRPETPPCANREKLDEFFKERDEKSSWLEEWYFCTGPVRPVRRGEIFYTKRNKPWKVLCTFSYKVKMISSLSLRAVWKLFFSFSLAVSSGPFNCGGVRQLLYKLYSTNFKIVQF